MRKTLTRHWHAFAEAVGTFLDEAAFRASLAVHVLLGRMPVSGASLVRRTWDKGEEPPLLLEVFDWTDARALFSIIIWPPLEADEEEKYTAHRQRYQQVLGMVNDGSGDRRWTMRLEVGELTWSPIRKAWIPYGGGEGLPSSYALVESREAS